MIPAGFLKAWAGTALFILAIDAVWLGLVAKGFYRSQLGDLMLESPRLSIAALFYVMYSAAVVILASAPAARSGSIQDALLLGAIFGFAAYGTYDITNLSTLKNWPVMMSLVDIAWGTALTALAAAAGFWLLRSS
ncbi:MAG: membrane protein [Hoeflea sp. BRH_c9]|nr:MAG: membrane protein [Hoeflea sp. BRH_c9]